MNEKSFFRYFIELIIVVVGVTIAFWLNTRAETMKEKKILNNYYAEILADLEKDRKILENAIKVNGVKKDQMVKVARLYLQDNATRDSVFKYSQMIGNYTFFDPQDITYRSMVNSGDLKLINEFSVKRQMISLYDYYEIINEFQENHLEALDENYFPKYVYMVDYLTQEVVSPLEDDILTKNYFAFMINELGTHIYYYQSALNKNLKLDSLIQLRLH